MCMPSPEASTPLKVVLDTDAELRTCSSTLPTMASTAKGDLQDYGRFFFLAVVCTLAAAPLHHGTRAKRPLCQVLCRGVARWCGSWALHLVFLHAAVPGFLDFGKGLPTCAETTGAVLPTIGRYFEAESLAMITNVDTRKASGASPPFPSPHFRYGV